MDSATLTFVALAPVAAVFTFVYLRDNKSNREPIRLLLLNFLVGVLSAVPVLIVELWLAKRIAAMEASHFVFILTTAFAGVALVEEGFKLLGLLGVGYRNRHFDEPYDGIMYSVAVSLGFAAIENVLYTFQGGLEVGLLRSFSSIPGHAMMGVLMGYFVGLAKFQDNRFRKIALWMVGLLAATIVHGLYDFFLMYKEQMLFPLAFVVLIIGIVLGLRAMRLQRKRSQAQSQSQA
jgi:RsiW-degrading membrane proteinase PrsW (M82 family)